MTDNEHAHVWDRATRTCTGCDTPVPGWLAAAWDHYAAKAEDPGA